MRRPRNQDGVVAVVMALVICVVLIPIAALAVDLGVQRVARRDMQSVADVVALDMARQITGGKLSSYSQATLLTLAEASRDRNVDNVGSGSNGKKSDITVQLGTIDSTKYGQSGYFTVLTDPNSVPTAIRVAANTKVGFGLANALPKGGFGGGSAQRYAVGATDQTACYQLGSYALGVNSGNSALLNSLIGSALNSTVLSYNGLATANVTLLGLAAQLGAGTPDELVNLGNVSMGQVFVAAAQVLQQQGGDVASVQLLQLLSTKVGGLPPVNVADILGVTQGGGAALTGQVNLLDLVATSAFIADGSTALKIPSLTLNLLGLTNLTSSLSIIQKAQKRCGHVAGVDAHADNTQLALDVGGNLLSVPSILGLSATASVSLHADLASGQGDLTKIVCGNGTTIPEGVDVAVKNALTNIALGLNVRLVGNLGLVAVTIDVPVTAATSKSTATATAGIRVPPLTYQSAAAGALTSTPVETGQGMVGLNGLAVTGTPTVTAKLLGVSVPLPIPIGDILSPVLSLIANPLIATLDAALLGPLSSLLGLNVAGSDVYGVAHPNCNSTKLVG